MLPGSEGRGILYDVVHPLASNVMQDCTDFAQSSASKVLSSVGICVPYLQRSLPQTWEWRDLTEVAMKSAEQHI